MHSGKAVPHDTAARCAALPISIFFYGLARFLSIIAFACVGIVQVWTS
jgi:hypothetical protein